MHTRVFKLRDARLKGWKEEIGGRWSYRQLAASQEWFHGWVSFDALAWHEREKVLFCGLNSMDGDLLYRFDPETERFESLGTKAWTDAYDVKIHRTILVHPHDGSLYFGTSMLHDVEQQREAKGGKLVRYCPATGTYEQIGVPAPHLYIQSIAADWQQEVIYSFTYPAEGLFRTGFRGESSWLAWLGNAILFAQPHNAAVDGEGWLWGTYAETRAWDEAVGLQPVRLFKYSAREDRFVWFEHGLPRRSDGRQLLPDPAHAPGADLLGETRHKQDYGFCDSMVFDGQHTLYAGTVAGVLARIDTRTGVVEKVANAMPASRIPAQAYRDGVLYGGGGLNGDTRLFRWEVRNGQIEALPSPEADGTRPARIHEIAVTPEHRLYLAENDNHERSSYLWSVDIGG